MAAGESERLESGAEASGSGHLPVDLDHLRRYTMGDRQLEREILGLFADQLPVTIATLKSATTDKEWSIAAHTLKGSARAVGAWSIATIAECAEHLKPAAGHAEKGRLIRSMEEAADTARAFIASLDKVA